jgi:hypothetical protein
MLLWLKILKHVFLATVYGRVNIMNVLINAGANVDRVDNNTFSAVALGNFKLFKNCII